MRNPLMICAALALTAAAPTPALADWNPSNFGGMAVSVYTPDAPGAYGAGRSLLVVLHGCAQGTDPLVQRGGLAQAAEAHGMVISVPGAPGGGVLAGCWDYYGANHTRASRHNGPVLTMVDRLLADPGLDIDPAQVYVAGLSSGGGEAIVLGCLAPDVFAGVGVAAGPSVGTSSVQIAQVATDARAAADTCRRLAGANAADFATQLTTTINGDSDFVVARGYGQVTADARARIYADGGPALVTEPLDVAGLPGSNPAGRGEIYRDAHGPRIARIEASGMGHAWPAGTGQGGELGFVAGAGVNFAAFLGEFFGANNRRVDQGPRPVVVQRLETRGDGPESLTVTGLAGPAERIDRVEIEVGEAGGSVERAAVGVGADGGFSARFEGLVRGGQYVAMATPIDRDGVAGEPFSGNPVRLREPAEVVPPTVTIDGVEAPAGCVRVFGSVADGAGARVTLRVEDAEQPVALGADGRFDAEICGLSAGCYVAEVRAVDLEAGADAAFTDEVAVAEAGFVEIAEGTVTDHISRFANHAGGWGAADATYLTLFQRYGAGGRFPLYRGADGRWYSDPANLPASPAPRCGEPEPEPDPEPEPEPEPEPAPDPEPEPDPEPVVRVDAVAVQGDCVAVTGILADVAADLARLTVGERTVDVAPDAAGRWRVDLCDVGPGCLGVVLRVRADDGRKWRIEGPTAAVSDPAAEPPSAEGAINEHLPRYASHPRGYGAVDATYVELFRRFGLGGRFTLYQGPDGWYLDRGALPAAPPLVCD